MNGYDFNRYESEDSYYLLIRRDAALNSTDSTLNLLFAKYESEDSYYLLIRRDASLNSTDSTVGFSKPGKRNLEDLTINLLQIFAD